MVGNRGNELENPLRLSERVHRLRMAREVGDQALVRWRIVSCLLVLVVKSSEFAVTAPVTETIPTILLVQLRAIDAGVLLNLCNLHETPVLIHLWIARMTSLVCLLLRLKCRSTSCEKLILVDLQHLLKVLVLLRQTSELVVKISCVVSNLNASFSSFPSSRIKLPRGNPVVKPY